MDIIISFCDVYLGLVMADETKTSCEIIGAEGVTCKQDLYDRADMCVEPVNKMVDLRIEFFDESDREFILANRHELLYRFVDILARQGVVFDQFIITHSPLEDEGRHSYHILASIIDEGGFNVDVHNLYNVCESAGKEFVEGLELSDQLVGVTDDDPNIMMMMLSQAEHINRYGGNNPFCHELILPYRDQILADLAKSLFGKDESDNINV